MKLPWKLKDTPQIKAVDEAIREERGKLALSIVDLGQARSAIESLMAGMLDEVRGLRDRK